ncbi:O-antigen ligase family protein [Candidatus Entotheonella palauensis]|uniref:O-antigen ligase family protein n=1 Tax=Candidatus Entotheonella palauensis TaxID=93172 RepID=UPI001C4E0557|nr:O-antigen ligase family protein [Candidatus Entotheonella palauensis]
MTVRRFLPKSLYGGVLLLLIWTPLALGSVHPLPSSLMQVHIFLLTALWLGCRSGLPDMRVHRPRAAASGRVVMICGISLFGLFVSLLIFQLLPLPPETLKWLSPSTCHFYNQLMPHGLDTPVPLSLHASATRTSVVRFVAYASLFLLVADTIRTRRQFRGVVQVIVGVAWFMALLGMAQQFSGTTAIYWLRETGYSPYFFGPYINRNHCAAYLVIAVLLGLGLLFARKHRIPSEPTRSHGHSWLQAVEYWIGPRGLWVYALATIAGALCLSLSRGAILSLLAGLVLFALLRRSSSPASGAWRRWGWILAMIGAAGLWVGVDPLLTRLTVDEMSGELSSAGRLGLWRATWDMVKAFPLWGIGLSAYPVVFPRYQTAELNGHFLQAHNDLLQLIAETGWIGGSLLVGLLVLIGGGIVRGWQRRRDPFIRGMIPAGLSALVAMTLHALVDFNFHIPANAVLFTVVLALLYAGVRLPRRQKRDLAVSEHDAGDKNRAWRYRGALAVCGMAGVLWLCYGSARVVVANLWYPQPRFVRPHHWTQQASLSLRHDRLQRALRWHPNADTYWLSLADLEVEIVRQHLSPEDRQPPADMIARLRQADLWYQRALQQRPMDPDVHLGRLLGLQLQARFNPAQALLSESGLVAYAARVAALAPANPDLQYRLGAILLAQETATPGPLTHSRQQSLTSSDFFRQAIRLRPSLAKELLPRLLQSLPKVAALTRFTQAIPQTAEGLLEAARLMEDQSWLQARSLYLSGLASAPSKAQGMKRYGEALHRHGAYTAAHAIWEQLQAANPHDAGVYLKLADTQRRLGKNASAVRTLKQLVTRFPGQPEYRHQLAATYLHAGQLAEAQTEWQAVLRHSPYFIHAYIDLAQVYERQRDYTGAIAMMRKAIHMESGSIRFHSYLARLYRHLGANDVALREYQRLESFHPNNPDVLYQIGEYARLAGENRRAHKYYLRALRFNPDNVKFQQALDRLEE